MGNEFMIIIPSVGRRRLPDTQPPLTQHPRERRRETGLLAAALGLSFLITEMGRPFPRPSLGIKSIDGWRNYEICFPKTRKDRRGLVCYRKRSVSHFIKQVAGP